MCKKRRVLLLSYYYVQIKAFLVILGDWAGGDLQENQPGNHVTLLRESIGINVFSKLSKKKKIIIKNSLCISVFMVLYLKQT